MDSLKQDVESFLSEVMIIGQDIRQPQTPHRLHTATVCQAVLLPLYINASLGECG
jgi:hypothetical protein